MTRWLPYRRARWLLVWLACDIALTLVLMASVGPAYLEWRAEHPWLLPVTLVPFVWLLVRNRRQDAPQAKARALERTEADGKS